jgi:hypothetical protein
MSTTQALFLSKNRMRWELALNALSDKRFRGVIGVCNRIQIPFHRDRALFSKATLQFDPSLLSQSNGQGA